MQDKSVREIKEIIETLEVEKYMEYIELLRVDERKSVQGLAIKQKSWIILEKKKKDWKL